MSSTKNKTETKSKVETCCSEPAKRKLLIKIGIGVGVATVLLVVIIAVAVVMATRTDDTGSNPDTETAANSSTIGIKQSTTSTTVTPPSTTERARVVTVSQSRISVNLPGSLGGGKETLVSEADSQTQWVYYDTDDYAIYIIQKFTEGIQTIVAITRGADDLNNNYNGTILFCEESNIEGTFPTMPQIQDSQPSQNIVTQTNSQSFEAPSVILPLRTGKCSDLPDRLKYRPDMKTAVDFLGPVCSFLVSTDMSDLDTIASFSGDQCAGGSSLQGICRCYKQCLNCTLEGSRPTKLPACQCANYAKDALDSLSCSGTEDDGQCDKDRDSFTNHVQQNPCSCSFGVYFSYPCGVEPDGCEGGDCTLKWCFHGFQYPVTFTKMCANKVSVVQCTKT